MYGAFERRRRPRGSTRSREAGLYEDGARDRLAAGGARRRRRARSAQPVRQQLPRPRQPPRDRGGGARGARPLGLRHGLRALHLRHPDRPPRARGAALRVPRHARTRSSTPPASTPTAASSRRCSGRRTRSSPTRSTTPRSSTASGSARPQRYRYANSDMDELETRLLDAPGRPLPADRHRRRLLHGRLRRAARRHLRSRRAPRRPGHGGRLPRRRASSGATGRGTHEHAA